MQERRDFMNKSPIGIFDSGVGGLTVCKAIRELLPSEHIIYFGDTMRFPYGTKSIDTVIGYSREITDYFMTRGVKMVVCACNTASAAALEVLKAEYAVPVIGVIDAGARAACSRLSGNKLGVIATRATVKSGAYVRAVHALRPEADVLQQHASVFVSLVEEGWIDEEITRIAAAKYLAELYDNDVRTVILGCTHFPLLKNAIQDIYPDIDLVDTGREIACEVKEILTKKNLENQDGTGIIELYASDITDTLQSLKELFFGSDAIGVDKLILSGKL